MISPAARLFIDYAPHLPRRKAAFSTEKPLRLDTQGPALDAALDVIARLEALCHVTFSRLAASVPYPPRPPELTGVADAFAAILGSIGTLAPELWGPAPFTLMIARGGFLADAEPDRLIGCLLPQLKDLGLRYDKAQDAVQAALQPELDRQTPALSQFFRSMSHFCVMASVSRPSAHARASALRRDGGEETPR